jgi:hypothetical protein
MEFLNLKTKIMKKVLLATGLALGVLTFTMAGSNHATAPISHLTKDTVPQDTTQPTPTPDTTKNQ